MSDMIRKQLYITKAQDQVLKKKAASYGVSEAEIVREALDNQALVFRYEVNARDKWQQELHFINQCRKGRKDSSTERTWRRDDLYDR